MPKLYKKLLSTDHRCVVVVKLSMNFDDRIYELHKCFGIIINDFRMVTSMQLEGAGR